MNTKSQYENYVLTILTLHDIDYQMALNINDRKFQEAGYHFHLSLIWQYSHSSIKTFCVGYQPVITFLMVFFRDGLELNE